MPMQPISSCQCPELYTLARASTQRWQFSRRRALSRPHHERVAAQELAIVKRRQSLIPLQRSSPHCMHASEALRCRGSAPRVAGHRAPSIFCAPAHLEPPSKRQNNRLRLKETRSWLVIIAGNSQLHVVHVDKL